MAGAVTESIEQLEQSSKVIDLEMKLRLEHEMRLDVEKKLKDALIELGKNKGASEVYKDAFKWILELFKDKYYED